MRQSTIAQPVEWAGSGLHSGAAARVSLIPSPPDTGIVFVRLRAGSGETDVEIPASVRALLSGARATTLVEPRAGARSTGSNGGTRGLNGSGPGECAQGGINGVRIGTVEHLLATLYAVGIDNLRIEVDGPEIPVMDGSAAPILEYVRSAGKLEQSAERAEIELVEPIEIRDGDRWIRAVPSERLRISYAIDFSHPSIGRQALEFPRLDAASFEQQLAGARTFGFEHEVESLRAGGLARGGSLENTVVLGETGILNHDGLRFRDEFVRHKIIDLIGDLALLGTSLRAHVSVEKGGHTLHHRLVRSLAESVSRRAAVVASNVPVEGAVGL